MAGFIAARSEAGCGFRKSQISQSAVVLKNLVIAVARPHMRVTASHPADEAGYGFRKSRISKIGFGWVNEHEPEL